MLWSPHHVTHSYVLNSISKTFKKFQSIAFYPPPRWLDSSLYLRKKFWKPFFPKKKKQLHYLCLPSRLMTSMSKSTLLLYHRIRTGLERSRKKSHPPPARLSAAYYPPQLPDRSLLWRGQIVRESCLLTRLSSLNRSLLGRGLIDREYNSVPVYNSEVFKKSSNWNVPCPSRRIPEKSKTIVLVT